MDCSRSKVFYSWLESKREKFSSKSIVEPMGANKSRILYLVSYLGENFDSKLAKKEGMDFSK